MSTQRIRIKLKSYDHNLIDKSSERIVKTVKLTGAVVSGPVPLPTRRSIYTVNRSPHVDKKSREQFFLTEYHLIFSIDSNDPYFLISILKTISFYGVQIKMTNVSSSHLLLA